MSTASLLTYLQDLPALQPPPGTKANLAHPESKGGILVFVSSVLLVVMIGCFCARVYVRLTFVGKRGIWGDLSCLFATLFAVAYYIASIIGVTRGPVGKHQWDVTIGDVTSNDFIIAVAFLSNALVSPTLLLTKLTLFLLYLDLFRPFKWLRICVYIGICITILFYLTIGILMIIWSSPNAGETWQSHLFTMEQQYAQIYASPWSAVGLGIDLYLLGLPMKALADLCLPVRKKLAVGVVFLTGIFACIASALSVYYRFINKQSNTKDTTYALQNVIICSLAEMFIGVIISCMPATWSLLRQYIPHFLAFRSRLSSGLESFWKKSRSRDSTGKNDKNLSSLRGFGSGREDFEFRKERGRLDGQANGSMENSWDKERLAELGVNLTALGSVKVYFGLEKRNGCVGVGDDEIYLQRNIW